MKKLYCVICTVLKIRKTLNIKPFRKTLFVSIIYSKCKREDKKLINEEESIEILKILSLIENI